MLRYCFLFPLLLSLLTACSATRKVEELSAHYSKAYAAIPDYETLPRCRLSWQDALDKVEKNNLEYKEACRQLDNAKYQLGRTWRDLIPLLDAGYYYNAALPWSDGRPAQRNFNVNIVFNLPQLVQLPVERYTDALAIIKADTDCRLKKRELEAKLYKLFRERQLLEREWSLVQEKPGQDESEKRQARETHAEKLRHNWSELCALMNDHSARWEPAAAGLPRLRLSDYRKRAASPDKLYLATLALQAEAARLQKLGVFIRFLPSPRLNFYSPSLFSDTGGNTDGFMRNADDVRVNFNSYVTLDTRLENYHDYKDAAAGEKLALEAIEQNMREHRAKIQTVLKSWQLYEDWKLSREEYIAFRNAQGVTGFEEAGAVHRESLELEQSLIGQERSNLERECAAMQEYGWRKENP